MSESFKVKAGSTVTEGMALVFTGTAGEVDIATPLQESTFAGFAVDGADAGGLVSVTLELPAFIAGELFGPSDAGAELKFDVGGKLLKAAAAEPFVAKYYPTNILAGGGGDFFAGKGDEVTLGNLGRCRVSEGVKV